MVKRFFELSSSPKEEKEEEEVRLGPKAQAYEMLGGRIKRASGSSR